jgi:hypothetical protein
LVPAGHERRQRPQDQLPPLREHRDDRRVESCETTPSPSPSPAFLFSDPAAAVAELYAQNPTNPVKTYVIGMAFAENEKCDPNPADSAFCPKQPLAPNGGCKVVSGVNVCTCRVGHDEDCGSACETNDALGGKVHYTCGTDGICHHPAFDALNAMAAAGHTGKAHFAQNQIDIEAAFADIEADTVRIEVCNHADDDCDNIFDNGFPDVAEPAGCGGPNVDGSRNAATCDNGQRPGTHCFATGVFACSPDGRGEICTADTCATNPDLCPRAETCNGLDDDCNGFIDDCTPFVERSCCAGKCPPCAGFPHLETCNGCDDDCDGIVDNNLVDVGADCGTNNPPCTPGKTFCCQEASPGPTPSPGPCSQSQLPQGSNPDRLVCLGGVQPSPEACNDIDDNCNGLVDESISQPCYDGPAGTLNVGICHGGTQSCSAGNFGVCNGEQTPKLEKCNNLDDNCDGTVDCPVVGGIPDCTGMAETFIDQDCCPSGNLSDCQGSPGSPCHPGKLECDHGKRGCFGAVQKSAEVCNGIDDDCDGISDEVPGEVPGEGAACTGSGITNVPPCLAIYQCIVGGPGGGPRGLTCVQMVSPSPEACNNLDDDCNGVVDDPDQVLLHDPRIGQLCYNDPTASPNPFPAALAGHGTCQAGITECKSGEPACEGAVGPKPDVCGQPATSCTGVPAPTCPDPLTCVMGMCALPCAPGEFPCPGGFSCSGGLCVTDKCLDANCPVGFNCVLDAQGNAQCVDPCTGVNCGTGQICKGGACQDASCRTQGCPVGERCDGTPPMCVSDPCFGKTCPSGQFCDPPTGMCLTPCTDCPEGQVCLAGKCQADPCAGKSCPAGEVCSIVNDQGTCIQNECSNPGCTSGKQCCAGRCIADPCESFAGCPVGTACGLDDACHLTCVAPPRNEIVAGGGGGLGCDVSSGHSDSGALPLLALLLLFILINKPASLGRRLALGALLFLFGCDAKPYCLNCVNGITPGGDGGIHPDLLQPVDLLMATLPDLTTPFVDLAEGGVCVPTNGGVEICDGIDNDCNGLVDDNVDPQKLQNDPKNCGACGHSCDFTAIHQFGACDNSSGTPTCVPTTCTPGFRDIDPNIPGCEYACLKTNGGTEICDGIDNDCNGKIDDPFTTSYASPTPSPIYDFDIHNCGACGHDCNDDLPGAVTICAAGGVCKVDHCINIPSPSPGFETFRHNPLNGDINVTGCEYHCPSASSTGGDCMAAGNPCTFPVETCNGIDDDCNFVADDNPSDVGSPCGDNCPGGLPANCVGECRPGTTICLDGVAVCPDSGIPLGAGLFDGPEAEICDGKDNDCNGLPDDPFTTGYTSPSPSPLYDSDPSHCGSCGNACALANAINACRPGAGGAGECFVFQCTQTPTIGFSFLANGPSCASHVENGPTGCGCNYQCPVWPTSNESCNGQDDNCDGLVDNGLTAPSGICSTLGVCGSATIPIVCRGASGFQCDYSVLGSAVELDGSGNLALLESKCDGLDNNCNGVADLDGFPNKGKTCAAGVGACQTTGTVVCTGPTSAGCSASPAPQNASDEDCNGLDDDCDGQIDERIPSPGTQCPDGAGGFRPCRGWVDPMAAVPKSGGGFYYVYEYEASRPGASASSPGIVESRACSKPAVLPWANVTLTEAQAACASLTDSKGAPLRLCTAAEWQRACEGPSPSPAPRWSTTTPTSNPGLICDDVSEGRSGPWATATGPLCYSDWSSAGRVYDMSGNLGEWTSTAVVNSGTTYFRVRGGDFATDVPGTSCEFSFQLAQAGFASGNLGFRCCADNANCGDLTSDPANCGACGTVCSGGNPKCLNSACAPGCGAKTDCSNACVDTSSDPNHCGGCNTVCGGGQVCSGGVCSCATGTLCGGKCVDTQADPSNCGGCGNSPSAGDHICAVGQVCQADACQASCTSGVECSGGCVDTNTDENNCGGCGAACGFGQTCLSGACCNNSSVCGGACTDLQSDPAHCGNCSTACNVAAGETCQSGICCPSGQTNCGGFCKNLSNDPNNCNSCGNVCPTGTCVSGSCCPANQTQCGSSCVSLATDNNNCGHCFNQCTGGTVCTSGSCCPSGSSLCGGVCIDTSNDKNNCGGCGIHCGTGNCVSGMCKCPPYHSFCGGTCIFTGDDPNNCGGCGTSASPTPSPANICNTVGAPDCMGSECGACQFGYIPCDNGYGAGLRSCTDVTADRNNCGTCGTAASPSQGCVGGARVTLVQPSPFDRTLSGLCGADGLGPTLTFTDGTTPPACSGNLAATTFSFGICACSSFNGGGSPTIDAFDSTVEPQSLTPLQQQIGGSVGVNSAFTNSSNFSVSGDLVGFSTLNLGNTTVGERLQCEGAVTGGNYTVGGSATVKTIGASGSVGLNTTSWGAQSFPDHNLYANNITDGVCPAGWTVSNGGRCTRINPWVDLLEPCKRCASPTSPTPPNECTTSGLCQIPIQNFITYYSNLAHNNNALIGLASNALVNKNVTEVLELPCGVYYLDSISDSSGGGHVIQINAHGNTALFINGNISDNKPVNFYVDPRGHLDVFVKGTMLGANNQRLGNMNVPANLRMYFASSAATAVQVGGPDIMGVGIYTPNGGFSQANSLTYYGSLFTKDYLGGGSLNMHYDKAFADEALTCTPPTGNGCSTCLDCANQACVGGTCGNCTNDGQCCAPLRCVTSGGSACNNSGGCSCQFTGF